MELPQVDKESPRDFEELTSKALGFRPSSNSRKREDELVIKYVVGQKGQDVYRTHYCSLRTVCFELYSEHSYFYKMGKTTKS